MLFGNKERFALEISVIEKCGNWWLGEFVLWIAGNLVGESEDQSVDLKGCVNWIDEFLTQPSNRAEPQLFHMEKERVFLLLNHSVIAGDQDAHFVKERFEDIHSRFHISHLGMSSFEDVNLLLIESDSGYQRCIWQQGQDEVLEAMLKPGEIQFVLSKASQWFKKELLR